LILELTESALFEVCVGKDLILELARSAPFEVCVGKDTVLELAGSAPFTRCKHILDIKIESNVLQSHIHIHYTYVVDKASQRN